jgi:hypothetical protein
VEAAGPRARLGQDAPDHPLGRDQIGKLELDVHQLFTQVLGLPSELVAALPDPIEHPAHRLPLPPEIVISALSTERCCRCGGPIPARSRERRTINPSRRSSPPTGINTPDRPQTSPPTSAFKVERSHFRILPVLLQCHPT